MIEIPSQGWAQPNKSDYTGDIWTSFNLDTSDNDGRLRLGTRLILNTGTSDVAELTGTPIAFINNTFANFTFAGASNVGYAFKNDATIIGTFARDTSSGAPATIDSTRSDATLSGVNIYVSAKSSSNNTVSLYKKPPSSGWSEVTTTEDNTGSVYSNMLCSYIGRVYMSNTYSHIVSFDSSDTPSYSGSFTVSVGSGSGDPRSTITQLLPADDRIFILTMNLYGGQGHVYEWDGSTTNSASTGGVSYDHRLESAGALAGIMFEGTPYIIDTNGCLLEWNGGTFVEVARLNRENNIPLVYASAYSALNTRFIHPNGMTIVAGKIQILIDNKNADANSTIEEPIPSGIYEFDPKNPSKGLIHKHSICSNKSTDIPTEYGQVRITGAGALKNMNPNSAASGANGIFFAGSGYYTDATTVKYGIFYNDRNDTLPKAGYLISPKLQSIIIINRRILPLVRGTWTNFYTFFRKFLSANDKVVIKYRVTDVAPVEATVTWTSTTTFTTTTDISSYQGYEAEIIQGIGSGKCSQITSVTYSAGTYTVTLEDSFYSATGTSKARFQYWIKKDSIVNQRFDSNKTLIGVVSRWIQYKVFCLFTGKDEIEKFIIMNSPNEELAE